MQRIISSRAIQKKKTPELIISSNSARVQEALRVIEEFSRGNNNELSKVASKY